MNQRGKTGIPVMKKTVYLCVCIVVLALAAGCGERVNPFKKKPVITLVGSLDNYLAENDKYSDEGATAHDDKDGDISDRIIVSGLPSGTDKSGLYVIRYDVKNSEGVSANTVTRNVTFVSASFSRGNFRNIELQPNSDARYILSSKSTGLYVFDKSSDDKLVKILPYYYSDASGSASVSPEGKIAVINSKNIDIWDPSSWTLKDSFRAIDEDTENGSIYQVLFSPRGDTIATCATDGKIRIWRASSLTPVSVIESDTCCKFNTDGTKIGSESKSWYVEDGSVAGNFGTDSGYPWKKSGTEEKPASGGTPWQKPYDDGYDNSSYPFRESESETVQEPDSLPSYPWSKKGTYINSESTDESGKKHSTWERVEE